MTISRDRSTLARRLLAAALGVLASGCSFVSVQRARPPAAVEDPRVLDTCTTTPQAPIADTVLAGIGLVAGFALMMPALAEDPGCVETSTSSCRTGDPAGAVPGLAVFVAGAAFAGSAIYGHVATAKCRHRIAAGRRCAGGDLAACQRLKPAWAPPPAWRAGPSLEPRPPPAPASPPAPSSSEWTQDPAQP